MTPPMGLWLYGIVESRGSLTWTCRGIHGACPVRVVSAGGFAAVVSEEPLKKYRLDRDALLAHQKVNEAVLQTQRILPARFCTMAQDEEQIVRQVLLPKAGEFTRKFADIREKDEYGLRVRWTNLDEVFAEIGREDEKVCAMKEMILAGRSRDPRGALLDIGRLVQDTIELRNEAAARAIMAEISPLATLSKANRTLGDAMILNAAFLVENKRQGSFDATVESLHGRFGGRMQFKYVGPVPPFNFVEIVIRWEDGDAGGVPNGVMREGGSHVSPG